MTFSRDERLYFFTQDAQVSINFEPKRPLLATGDCQGRGTVMQPRWQEGEKEQIDDMLFQGSSMPIEVVRTQDSERSEYYYTFICLLKFS